MKKKITSPAFYLFLTGAFIFFVFCLKNGGEDPHFTEISNTIVEHTFADDTLSSYFTFQDPEEFGLETDTVSLPCYDREDYLSAAASLEETLDALGHIEPAHLSSQARATYNVLVPYLQNQKKGTEFPYFEEPLSSSSGIHISLPVLLAEFPVRNSAGLDRYLSVLSLIPAYFDSLVRFEADKAAAGMFMASEDASLVISQCDYFASEKGRQLFQDCFVLMLKEIYPENSISYNEYLKKHDTVLSEKVLPAYAGLADSILLLKEQGKARKGLCQYEKGTDYYEYRIRQLIGTEKSIEEIEEILYIKLEDLYLELAQLRADYSASDTGKQSLSATATLPVLQKKMKALFPTLHGTNNAAIKEIPAALADYTAPAYYFIPSICACRKTDTSMIENTIYVGSEIKNDPIELFTTIAHEGYPGHMYQNVYFLQSQGVNRKNVLRYCMDFPGYSEGWAMYVELLSFSYADGDPTYLEMLKLSREIQICLLSILDMRVHIHGADVSEITPYLANIGIKEPDIIENVYSYLVNEPGTYLKYYVGYLELLECKQLFRKKCTAEDMEYSDLDFHTFFLSHGPDSYTNIKKCLQ